MPAPKEGQGAERAGARCAAPVPLPLQPLPAAACPARGREASRRRPRGNVTAWRPHTWAPAGREPSAGPRGEPEPQAPRLPDSAPGHAGKPRPSPRPPPPAAQPSAAPCRRGVDPATRAGPASAPPDWQLRRSPGVRSPPPDWLRSGAEAPPISPGPLITRLQALPGPGSRPRAFLSGLQRREVRHGRVAWAAERWHGSTPRGAGVAGCRGPSALPPSLPPPA